MKYNIKYSRIKQSGGCMAAHDQAGGTNNDELSIDQMIALGFFGDDTSLTNKQICDEIKEKMNDPFKTIYDVPNDGNCGYVVMLLKLIFDRSISLDDFITLINDTAQFEYEGTITGDTFNISTGTTNRIIWSCETVEIAVKDTDEFNSFRTKSIKNNSNTISFNLNPGLDPTKTYIIRNKRITEETDISYSQRPSKYCDEFDENGRCFPQLLYNSMRVLFPNNTPNNDGNPDNTLNNNPDIYAIIDSFEFFSDILNYNIILNQFDPTIDYSYYPITYRSGYDKSIEILQIVVPSLPGKNHFLLIDDIKHMELYNTLFPKGDSVFCNSKRMTITEFFNAINYNIINIIKNCNQ